MKQFFIKLIIAAMMLTSPLSFTGDSCPDLKPDCSRNRYIAEALTASEAHQKTSTTKTVLDISPICIAATTIFSIEIFKLSIYSQLRLESNHGRAPPQKHTASV